MDSNKMKTVKKIIIKNILAWTCILCLVLCAMPHGVNAEGDDGNVNMDTGEITNTSGEVESGNSETESQEDTDEGDTTENSGSTTESTDNTTESTPEDTDEPVETRTITITLTLDGQPWNDADVEVRSGNDKYPAGTPEEGVYSVENIPAGQSLSLWIEGINRGDITDVAETNLTRAFYQVSFWNGEEEEKEYTDWHKTVMENETIANPGTPAREGYTFAGWKTAAVDGEDFKFDETSITAATKLYAAWTTGPHGHIYGEYEEVTSATCTAEGVEKRTCTICGHEEERPIAKLPHSFDEDQWETDTDAHWHICSVCGEKTEEGEHIERWMVTTRPTTTEPGERTYTCRICNKELRTEEIPALGENHTHTYDEEWLYNSSYHWKECVCGAETMKVLHTWDEGRISKEPTAEAEGTRIYTCTICGAESKVSIPRKEGIVEKGTNRGQNAPNAEFAMDTKELAGIVLTEEELQDKSNARITLTINNITSHVDIRDRVAVEQVLGAYQVGQYLDITLCKEVDSNEKDWITETSDKLRIAIHVPSTLLNYDTGRITRTYAVIRVHDGKAEILQDLDNSLDIITIETDRFSTYAIVYRDTVNGSGNQGDDNNNPDDSGNTGNTGNNGGNSGNNGNNSNNENNSGNTNNGDNSGNNNGGNSGNNNSGNSGSGTTEGNNSSNSGTTINNYTTNNTTFSSSINTTDGNKAKGTPKTGDAMAVNLYATLAMISGLGSIFYGRQGRMTEKDKDDLISAVSRRAKNRGITGKCFAVFAIASILLYYHTIGKIGKANVK